MKNLIFLAACLLMVAVYGQNNLDNVWVAGFYISGEGTADLNFNTNPPQVYATNRPINMATNASICDTLGNLLFYTNAVSIRNSNDQLIENGANLGSPNYTDANDANGLPFAQGVMILPYPDHPNWYAVVHETLSNYPNDVFVHELLLTVVDMSENEGAGRVISKNIPVFEATLARDGLTAVRHGNGRDWWVILKEYGSNCNYLLKLTPSGFVIDSKQCLGLDNYPLGFAVFSPNGTKFIQTGGINKIFDFDRCTGVLSLLLELDCPPLISVSPNSRYLYAGNYTQIYQYDLQSDNIINSETLVAECGWPTSFSRHQLGPDGKIYIVGGLGAGMASTSTYHVINQPNEPYPACNFVQHQVVFPMLLGWSMTPNLPNYRLGALPPERCAWAVGVETATPQSQTKDVFSIYPNPASNQLHITSTIPATFVLYDLLGRAVRQVGLGSGTVQVSVLGLPAGTYFYQIINPQKQILQHGKLSIVH